MACEFNACCAMKLAEKNESAQFIPNPQLNSVSTKVGESFNPTLAAEVATISAASAIAW